MNHSREPRGFKTKCKRKGLRRKAITRMRLKELQARGKPRAAPQSRIDRLLEIWRVCR